MPVKEKVHYSIIAKNLGDLMIELGVKAKYKSVDDWLDALLDGQHSGRRAETPPVARSTRS